MAVLLRRHRSEQYLTSSQHFSHFFRQAKGFSQTKQTFWGKLVFLCAIDLAHGFMDQMTNLKNQTASLSP